MLAMDNDRSPRLYLVVGLGNFGATVALELATQGHRVAVIDVDAKRVEQISESIDRSLIGSGTESVLLEELGAGPNSAAIVSTGRDITASALTVLALRDLGVATIYAKVISELHSTILLRVGATETIFPEHEAALWLGRRCTSDSILHSVDLGRDITVHEVRMPEAWVGQTLRDLELPRRHSVTVIALRVHEEDRVLPAPSADQSLRPEDSLFLAGRQTDLSEALSSSARPARRERAASRRPGP